MILLDAIYINNSGGKILLDYLILNLEQQNLKVHYLLDARVKDTHPEITPNRVTYLAAGLLARHTFYKSNSANFKKVLCFGNIPPSIRLNSTVYTYLHQRMFLEVPEELGIKQKIGLLVKRWILKSLLKNTDFWMVQTAAMEQSLLHSFAKVNDNKVIKLPFYAPLEKNIGTVQKELHYCYVSSGASHKNHVRLIEAFIKFSDNNTLATLELTVGPEFKFICSLIEKAQSQGCNIINHGMLRRNELAAVYKRSKFLIFPSLSESFGLGIVEAIESGCKVIGADLPYMYEVCKPSITFDPLNVDSIIDAFKVSTTDKVPETEQRIHDEIEKLIGLLKD